MSFTTQIDVANRALQHLGIPRITAFTDSSRQAKEMGFAVDKIRRSLLRRSVWTFATRRAVLRNNDANTRLISFPTYSAAVTYGRADIVQDSTGYLWISNRATNLAQTPGAGGVNPYWLSYWGPTVAQGWSSTVSYIYGDMVWNSTTAYIAINTSLNNTPVADAGAHWLPLNSAGSAATVSTGIAYAPFGYATSVGVSTNRLLYPLPANFLRIAPQDPKAAAVVRLGVTAGMQYNDWEIENNYLVTNDTAPIIFRFVADTTDVTQCDDLFNEMWAAQLAVETCETLTQSHEKLSDMLMIRKDYLDIAKLTNAIEVGSTENEIPEGGVPAQGGQPAQGGR